MDKILYLLRRPLETVPSSLYQSDNCAILTLAVKNSPRKDASHVAHVVKTGQGFRWKVGDTLSYSDLLVVVSEVDQVITL